VGQSYMHYSGRSVADMLDPLSVADSRTCETCFYRRSSLHGVPLCGLWTVNGRFITCLAAVKPVVFVDALLRVSSCVDGVDGLRGCGPARLHWKPALSDRIPRVAVQAETPFDAVIEPVPPRRRFDLGP